MTELLAESPYVFIAIVFAFTLLIGSFLNVVIYRLPLMMEREWRLQCDEFSTLPKSDIPDGRFNLVVPRSRCPSCKNPIVSWQNIPVLSYLALGGRCGNCKTPISTRYPLIEAATALLAALVAYRFGFGWETLMAVVLTLMLIPITMIDFDHQLIPDSIVLPLLWVGLGMSLFHPVAGSDVLFITPREAIIGAIAGYLTLWSFYWAFKLITGKEGMGYGDFKLLGALGAWLGYQYLFTIVMLSAVVGAILGIALVVFRGRDHKIPMPFGPFLAAAGYFTMLYGDAIKDFLRLPF